MMSLEEQEYLEMQVELSLMEFVKKAIEILLGITKTEPAEGPDKIFRPDKNLEFPFNKWA